MAASASGVSFAAADPDLRITGVRLVKTRPKNPLPAYEPAANSCWVTREAARPITIYPQYTGRRGPGSKWMPDPNGPISPFTVEITTNKGVTGYGSGGDGRGGQ